MARRVDRIGKHAHAKRSKTPLVLGGLVLVAAIGTTAWLLGGGDKPSVVPPPTGPKPPTRFYDVRESMEDRVELLAAELYRAHFQEGNEILARAGADLGERVEQHAESCRRMAKNILAAHDLMREEVVRLAQKEGESEQLYYDGLIQLLNEQPVYEEGFEYLLEKAQSGALISQIKFRAEELRRVRRLEDQVQEALEKKEGGS